MLTVVVLSRRNMLTSTNAFLSALAVSDSIKLINDILYFFVILFLRIDPSLGNRAHGYLYPYAHFVFNMSVCVSSWLTVSVAVERYILVCLPTRARTVWSRRRAVMLCTFIYFVMTTLALPSVFRYRTIHCIDHNTSLPRLDVELTELWKSNSFVIAYTWAQNLIRSIIPLVILVVLNTCIIYVLSHTKARRRRNSRHRVTIMMIVVILAFLICITPDAILSTVFGFGYYEASNLTRAIREITDTLLTINAAINFLIYCAFNQVFRKSFSQLCRKSTVKTGTNATGWVTEMDESTYRRLSEAQTLILSNNNGSTRTNNSSHTGSSKQRHLSSSIKSTSSSKMTDHKHCRKQQHDKCLAGIASEITSSDGDSMNCYHDYEHHRKSQVQSQNMNHKLTNMRNGIRRFQTQSGCEGNTDNEATEEDYDYSTSNLEELKIQPLEQQYYQYEQLQQQKYLEHADLQQQRTKHRHYVHDPRRSSSHGLRKSKNSLKRCRKAKSESANKKHSNSILRNMPFFSSSSSISDKSEKRTREVSKSKESVSSGKSKKTYCECSDCSCQHSDIQCSNSVPSSSASSSYYSDCCFVDKSDYNETTNSTTAQTTVGIQTALQAESSCPLGNSSKDIVGAGVTTNDTSGKIAYEILILKGPVRGAGGHVYNRTKSNLSCTISNENNEVKEKTKLEDKSNIKMNIINDLSRAKDDVPVVATNSPLKENNIHRTCRNSGGKRKVTLTVSFSDES